MKKLKNWRRLLVLLILFLSVTQGVSQKVVIDSTNQTTLLDKKATIAQGNIVRERNVFKELYKESRELNDSLRVEVELHKKENNSLEFNVIQPLELKFKESKLENKYYKGKNKSQQDNFDTLLKVYKNRKWYWAIGGFLVGMIVITAIAL